MNLLTASAVGPKIGTLARGATMKIDILKLREMPYEYNVDLSPAYLSEGTEEGTSFSDGRGRVTFRMVGDDIFADGTLRTDYHATCARCLGPATATVKADVHLIYWPKDPETGSKIANIEPEEPDFAIYEGEQLDPDEELREVLLVEVPLVVVCKDDCKGLCPRCGTNLNEGACDCGETTKEVVEEVVKPAEPAWKKQLKQLKID